MSLFGPLLSLALALVASVIVPGVAFLAARRAGWTRRSRTLALALAAVLGCALWSLGFLALRDPQPTTQHSQFEGLDVLLTWSIFGGAHLLVLVVLLFLDRRAVSSSRKS